MQTLSAKRILKPPHPLTLGALVLIIVAACGLFVARRWHGVSTCVVPLASGRFHQVAHKGNGRATICELPGKRRLLVLTEFATAASADLEVLLIRVPDAYENESVELAEPISLGDLMSNEGDQTYLLPDDIDLTAYRAVTIWNKKYRVNFTTAPLAPQ